MVHNNDTSATLVIGATGFLGKALVAELNNLGNLYKSIRESIEYIKSSSGLLVDLAELKKFRVLNVLNCSSGRLQSFPSALQSNREYPLRLLNKLLDLKMEILWIQFDSYTQYSQSDVHDLNYVNAKNIFNGDLDKVSREFRQIKSIRISLPHLYGENDKPERLIPRIMVNILNGVDVTILSPFEKLPLLDVHDCARELMSVDFLAESLQHESNRFSIEPTEQVEIFEFFDSYRGFCNSRGRLLKGETRIDIWIEKWHIQEQPRALPSTKRRRSREETFVAIHRCLGVT